MSARPLRLMFMSRHAMLDKTSGAAMTVLELMRRASRRGLPTRIVTGTVFDVNPPRSPEEADVTPWGPLTRNSFEGHELWHVTHDGVDNVLLRTANTSARRLNEAEAAALEALWERETAAFQPDVVLMYCGLQPERRMLARLRERGVKRVLHLANGSYKHAPVFNEVDLIQTTSVFLRSYYQELDGIEPWVCAPVIDPDQVVAPRHEPRYITLINPEPAKGATLFWQIAGLAAQQVPHAEFLVVESRGHARSLHESHGLDLAALPNVTVWPLQADMREVYRRTRILLMPSFWTECFGRVVVEAGWNGIPTLGARQGGIPEAMNGGGLALPIPARCQAMYTAMPTPAEAQPWVDAIARWLSDADAYAIAQCRARAGAAPFEPERVVTAILDRFNRLTEGFDIGQAPAGALAGTTVVHLDTSAEGLGLLHPAFRDAAWRVLRLGPGARDDAPPHRLLETVGDGCATAVQADGALCGQNAETAVITLRQISRVLEESGYAVLAMSHGVPFTRDQLKQASDRVGFQQIAMSNSTDTQFRAILSKTRRSQKDWIVLSHLFLPARQAASE